MVSISHHNANQNQIESVPASIPGAVYTSTPADLPDPPFRCFEGLVPRLGTTLGGTSNDQLLLRDFAYHSCRLVTFSYASLGPWRIERTERNFPSARVHPYTQQLISLMSAYPEVMT